MNAMPHAIDISGLVYHYGRAEAVEGLDLAVRAGRCYGLFGRNGAGKTTTVKCLLGLLKPRKGRVAVFGMDPQREEVAVKSAIGYVPEQVAFYPWMSVQDTLDYAASFRKHWNRALERDLVSRLELDAKKKTSALSKGMRAQLALVCAICPEPDLLVLDEPTSGLDPIVRREFLRTVIGAYQEGAPERRTVFVSTHLISEFEGLIDEFTIMDKGRAVLTMDSDAARERYRKIRARFEGEPPKLELPDVRELSRDHHEVEYLLNGKADALLARLAEHHPITQSEEHLTLEEIFVATLSKGMRP